jgi:UDP-N-acetylglucosamine 2-epimerase
MTVVGTRPELIRLCRVIALLDVHTRHVLVHTGQNFDYELNEVFFHDLGIRKPDHFLAAAGDSAVATIANILLRVDPVLASEKPDAMLVLGDTNSCLAVIAAKRHKIPVFHMEAGNRCFDERVPEEINRRLIDHLSDINLPYSERARELLLREGFPPDRVIKTGSPMYEVLKHYQSRIEESDVLTRLNLKPRDFFVVSSHREENVDNENNLRDLAETLSEIASRYRQRIIFSTHPRTRKRIEMNGIKFDPLIELHAPFGFLDFVALQLGARAVMSDSGTITEESAIFNFPALTLRETHERHEGMEESVVMMAGLKAKRVIPALEILLQQPRDDQRLTRLPPDYAAPGVSHKMLRIILSYTDYVNRTVWFKT